jgi:lipopolysaccharide/colanic/teichoic acid biosynthesis glycosyltransferase
MHAASLAATCTDARDVGMPFGNAGLLQAASGDAAPFDRIATDRSHDRVWSTLRLATQSQYPTSKRLFDIAVAGGALIALAPLLVLIAVVSRVFDGPGVVFRQQRVGLGERHFTLLKFRSLTPAVQHESATRWSIAEDTRVSPWGKFLRRSSLDELPQLINVVKGDMSLVGPRPERPHFVSRFTTQYRDYRMRHRMPAGLTGLAQVNGLRGDTSIAERAHLDNHYIERWSLWLDLRIMLRTPLSMVKHGGR